MHEKKTTTFPRLYVDQDFEEQASLILEEKQTHYLKTVLRRQEGDLIRIFNGRQGEWVAALGELKKKAAQIRLDKCLAAQPPPPRPVHLLFAPIKKRRMDILIEKAVELGVSDLHPVVTARSEIRSLNVPRLRAQIIEAAEQCERMDIPRLYPFVPLEKKLAGWDKSFPILWGNERGGGIPLYEISQDRWAFLIGPVGGFTREEACRLEKIPFVHPLSLGPRIYRVETASILCLAQAVLHDKGGW